MDLLLRIIPSCPVSSVPPIPSMRYRPPSFSLGHLHRKDVFVCQTKVSPRTNSRCPLALDDGPDSKTVFVVAILRGLPCDDQSFDCPVPFAEYALVEASWRSSAFPTLLFPLHGATVRIWNADAGCHRRATLLEAWSTTVASSAYDAWLAAALPRSVVAPRPQCPHGVTVTAYNCFLCFFHLLHWL